MLGREVERGGGGEEMCVVLLSYQKAEVVYKLNAVCVLEIFSGLVHTCM